MSGLKKKKLLLNSVEAYACICPAFACNCPCPCTCDCPSTSAQISLYYSNEYNTGSGRMSSISYNVNYSVNRK